jgi:hypothetical protein
MGLRACAIAKFLRAIPLAAPGRIRYTIACNRDSTRALLKDELRHDEQPSPQPSSSSGLAATSRIRSSHATHPPDGIETPARALGTSAEHSPAKTVPHLDEAKDIDASPLFELSSHPGHPGSWSAS